MKCFGAEMIPANQEKLRSRVVAAAEAALEARGYASAIDVLLGIGWLQQSVLDHWRQGRVPYLERGIQANLARISAAMHLLRSWATQQQLRPSETQYVARKPGRPELRFSKSGDATVERWYRTHWLSSGFSTKSQNRLVAKASRPPELVVIQPNHDDWKCHRCGSTGGLLMMEDGGPRCLPCSGLGSLVFLRAGDAALTRRAKAHSRAHAVVVRFSRSRKRYERQGVLVEPGALAAAERELAER